MSHVHLGCTTYILVECALFDISHYLLKCPTYVLGHVGGLEQYKNGGSKTDRNPAPSDHCSRSFMRPSKASPWSRADRSWGRGGGGVMRRGGGVAGRRGGRGGGEGRLKIRNDNSIPAKKKT